MSKKTSDTIESKEPVAAPKTLSPLNAALTKEQKIDLYRTMVRIRRFEERSLRAYQGAKIGGFLHLYIGQEAVAVGCCSLMTKNDHVITAYRDHGHALAVGMSMNECMAELYGKATGCSKGKGGSMHFFAPDKNYWGGHGIVGGQIPLGVGLAYGLKYKGLKGAAMAFMGDGAVNQGAVHEAYNLAALWDLPAVVIIENNGYSMGTSQPRSSAGPSLAKRAEGYGMAWDLIDGHNVYEVRDKVNIALERARNELKPSVLEIKTYRYRGHSVADAKDGLIYRTKAEIEEYQRSKDPISVFQATLSAEGVLTEESALAIDTAAREEADRAADFAEQSPFPTADAITQDIYWEEDNRSDKTTSTGRIIFE